MTGNNTPMAPDDELQALTYLHLRPLCGQIVLIELHTR
jgi:hypothetical protein